MAPTRKKKENTCKDVSGGPECSSISGSSSSNQLQEHRDLVPLALKSFTISKKCDRSKPNFVQQRLKTAGFLSSAAKVNIVKKSTKANKVKKVEVCNEGTSGTAAGASAAAMQISSVLELIGTHLPTQQLTKLRDTCQLWNQLFTPELKKKKEQQYPICLHGIQNLNSISEHDILSHDLHSYKPLEQFTDLMKANNKIPITSFIIFDLPSIRLCVLKNFYSVCGSALTRLQLTFSSTFDQSNFDMGKLRQAIFVETPNLMELQLRIKQDLQNQSWINYNRQQPQERLKKELPNLKSFTFETSHRLGPDSYQLLTDILEAAVGLNTLCLLCSQIGNEKVLSSVRSSMKHLNNLKILKIYNLLIKEIRILIELTSLGRPAGNQLQLEEFFTSIVYMPAKYAEFLQLFENFLVTQADTLNTFQIKLDGYMRYPSVPAETHIRLPYLPRLQHFEWKRYNFHRFDVMYDNGGTIGTSFPSLKVFTYKFNRLPGILQPQLRKDQLLANFRSDMENFGHEGVLELNLFNVAYSETLSAFSTRLPAVTRLNISFTLRSPLDSAALAPIWIGWPTLTTLQLSLDCNSCSHEVNLDELLTGIPASNFELLNVELPNTSKKTMTLRKVRTLLAKYKTSPGLVDLKQLRRFGLEFADNGCPYKITEIGGIFCFAVNSGFQYIQIRNTKNLTKLISPACRDLIRKIQGPYAMLDF